MYAVFTNGGLSYLGECQDQALSTFNSKPGSTLHQVSDLDELHELVEEHNLSACAEDPGVDFQQNVSEAFQTVVNKLDEWGINKALAEKVRDGGEKLVGEARSLGIQGMKTVGEGFVALGELLRKASKDDDCGGDNHGGCCGLKH
jgi:hypothetical protein